MIEEMISQIHISVRGLVEFILRHGDIDNRRKASTGPVMLEGANLHRMIQRRQGREYQAEVYLSVTLRRGDCEIVIDGRADGIIRPETVKDRIGENHVVIDEIKTTYRDLERIKEPEAEHLAQAKVYAYILAKDEGLEKIGVRMTYCNLDTKEIRYFEYVYSFEEISTWFDALIKAYVRWADFETGWKKIRNMSIEDMAFPYEYREGQRELMGQVYSSITKRERLFVMAPTGVGKTLANVYPAIKALSQDKADKIFYLTAKTITRTVASDCVSLLRGEDEKTGLRLKSVTLTAKEKICPLEKCECNPEACPYAKGHFDKINDAMYDLLINEDEFSREKIMEYADKHQVCPFEFSLDMSLFSDMIICDYNYVFDPNVYLRRFFGDTASGRFLFLVDEAHNLAERAMRMYSARVVKEDILDAKKIVRHMDPSLSRMLERCNRKMLEMKRECEDIRVVSDLDELVVLLLRLCGSIEQFLDDHDHFEGSDEFLEFYFNLRHFLAMYETMDEQDYVQYTKLDEHQNFEANLMCANPAKRVRACCDKAVFTVFFSATLIPIDYYRMMLGADEKDPAVYARSVFDPANRALLVARDVTSRYKRRSDSEYDRMAEYISAIVSAKEGNYIVFFPSFAMLDRVHEMFMSRYHDPDTHEIIVQSPSMSEAEREEFLDRFDTGGGVRSDATKRVPQTRELFSSGEDCLSDWRTVGQAPLPSEQLSCNTLIGFCVLGGIFSEGIDLKNDALIGAIIVGTGLPMVCAERDLMKRCYDDMGLDGFAYAYRFPGMNKVLQAAGRVIRTEDDRGVVALLDERFLGRDYLRLFPREWEDYTVCRCDDIAEALESFWSEGNV